MRDDLQNHIQWVLTTVFSFDNLDGGFPFGGLVQVANGDFYGTTEFGGAYMYGTVFQDHSKW